MIFDKKRSESDIIYVLLSEAKVGIKKTRLMYRTNMSNTQLTRYLNILMEKDIIEEKPLNPHGKKYCITEKGEQLFDPLKTVIKLLR